MKIAYTDRLKIPSFFPNNFLSHTKTLNDLSMVYVRADSNNSLIIYYNFFNHSYHYRYRYYSYNYYYSHNYFLLLSLLLSKFSNKKKKTNKNVPENCFTDRR